MSNALSIYYALKEENTELRNIINEQEQKLERAMSAIFQHYGGLYNQKKQRIRGLTHSQFSIDTLDFLFKYPIFSTTQFREGSRIPKASVNRILQILTRGEVIKIIEKI